MDELELLKKDWQRQDNTYPKLSYDEIYKMILKKSSSIVKWILYISIAELVFWIVVNVVPYFYSDTYKAKLMEIYDNDVFLSIVNVFTYLIILLFIYLLFRSYKSIRVTDNAKQLMENILNTRKIVRYYVAYNLVMVVISILFGVSKSITGNQQISVKLDSLSNSQLLLFYMLIVVFTVAALGLIWLFYRLIYGILLKRLNTNYNELKRMEI